MQIDAAAVVIYIADAVDACRPADRGGGSVISAKCISASVVENHPALGL